MLVHFLLVALAFAARRENHRRLTEITDDDKTCLRNRLGDVATCAFDACSLYSDQAANASTYKSRALIVKAYDSHMVFSTFTVAMAYEDLLAESAEHFGWNAEEFAATFQYTLRIENQDVTMMVDSDKTLERAFAIAQEWGVRLMIHAVGAPTMDPTPAPSFKPSVEPTNMPSLPPTYMPSGTPTEENVGCQNGATLYDNSPDMQIMVCKDMSQQTCEQQFESLCPPAYDLCSVNRYNQLNNNWNAQSKEPYLGKAYCRTGNHSAGHIGFWGNEPLSNNLGHSYTWGSSLPGCTHNSWGCNEQQYSALCCSGDNSDRRLEVDEIVGNISLEGTMERAE